MRAQRANKGERSETCHGGLEAKREEEGRREERKRREGERDCAPRGARISLDWGNASAASDNRCERSEKGERSETCRRG